MDKEDDKIPEIFYKTERFLDKYNHLMELIRTLIGLAALTLQIVILYKLFYG
jgi:hypothetical protein